MSKRNQDYKKLLEEIIESLKHTPEELNKALDTPKKMWKATKDMTKDEYALISRYVKSNLKSLRKIMKKTKKRLRMTHLEMSLLSLFGKAYLILPIKRKSSGWKCFKILSIKDSMKLAM